MLTEKELEAAIKRITDRLDEVNRLFVKKIAAQILKIGELNQSSINRLIVMADMGADVADINRQLQEATALNIRDLFKIYQAALTESYTDPRFKMFLQQTPLSQDQRDRITQFAQNVSVQTATAMVNISNTTAVQDQYKDAIDKAITAVSVGLTDYQSATREVVRDIGYNGLQVYYESGYHRRLDTAVRQNIIDGVNQINQNASLEMGEALGFDAIELSAHAHSAPDHEPVQGRVFLKTEFEKMQNGEDFTDVDGHRYEGFSRPIGEWNCMHIAMGFSTAHSVRRYTEDQLKQWAADNAKGCTFNGKHLTTYQAQQLMRQMETRVRREKDAANAARAVNDDALRKTCQIKINALSKKYYELAKTAGLKPHGNRLSVEGFKAVKV